MKDFNNISIEDNDENFISGGALGIKEIALEQFRRCIVEGSKEMVRGRITSRYVNNQEVIIEIPNQREVFSNCVKSLKNCVTAQLLGTTQLDEINLIEGEIRRLENFFNENKKRLLKNSSYFNKSTHKKEFNRNYFDENNLKNLEILETEKVEHYRTILMLISTLLKDLNYFDEGGASN